MLLDALRGLTHKQILDLMPVVCVYDRENCSETVVWPPAVLQLHVTCSEFRKFGSHGPNQCWQRPAQFCKYADRVVFLMLWGEIARGSMEEAERGLTKSWIR
jgi:hypothetical protein